MAKYRGPGRCMPGLCVETQGIFQRVMEASGFLKNRGVAGYLCWAVLKIPHQWKATSWPAHQQVGGPTLFYRRKGTSLCAPCGCGCFSLVSALALSALCYGLQPLLSCWTSVFASLSMLLTSHFIVLGPTLPLSSLISPSPTGSPVA